MTCPEISADTPVLQKMTTRCWIHIGMHKTGSTAIQQNLAKIPGNPTWKLMRTGGRPNMGAALGAMFDDEPHKLFWFKQREQSREVVMQKGRVWKEELQRDIQDLDGRTCIISAEFLSGFAKETLCRFHDFLLPQFDEIRVIGYVRPPISYCVLQYQEMLKYGHSNFNIDQVHLDYRSKFEKFDEIFGRDLVLLRKFDPGKFPERCIVRDFCLQTGIEFPEDIDIQRRNTSLSREACGILYAYRKYGPPFGKGDAAFQENAQLVKALAGIKGDNLNVHHDLTAEMLESKADDIMWMENRLGASLKERTGNDEACVSSEQDLLTISRRSCRKFASRFGKQQQRKIPRRWVPEDDPVAPMKVAEFVGKCRELAKEENDPSSLSREFAESPGKKPFKRLGWFKRIGKLVKYCRERIRQATGSK